MTITLGKQLCDGRVDLEVKVVIESEARAEDAVIYADGYYS